MRLVKSSKNANSARFENMLITTRRTPLTIVSGVADTYRALNPASAVIARTSFFSRHFSSSSEVLKTNDFASTKLLSSKIANLQRLSD